MLHNGPGRIELPSTGTFCRSLRQSSQMPHTVAYVNCKQSENCNIAVRNRASNGAAVSVHVWGPGTCVLVSSCLEAPER